ncbi:hypothetical protein D3C75_742390 [compost metagenome]
MYRVGIQGIVQLHILFRHVREIIHILAGTDTDIAIHLLHTVQVDFCPGFKTLPGSIFKHAAQDGTVGKLHKRMAPCFAHFLHNSFD